MAFRRGWRYMGVFERSPEKKRLHFHGIFYIPDGQMVGEVSRKRDFSTTQNRMQFVNVNSFFLDRFGRNDFAYIREDELRNGDTNT